MPNQVRFATFNASLNRNEAGQLIQDLSAPENEQAQTVAEIIQRVNPDVLLINEFDFDSDGEAAQLFQENYLGVSQNGLDPVAYPFVYLAPANTGIASGFDLDNNGEIVTTPGADGYGNDAFGFGNFPGQFAMVLYSKYPIVEEQVRTFQNFLWQDMPGALLPDNLDTPEANDWYSEAELEVFPLSSKSHWDIPIEINGEIVHVLASHPTPPVFDGDEDRNGRRNHDEIRFFADYITPGAGDYIYDDAGNFGGLDAGDRFVIMGDQNADPFDGDSVGNAINQLLENPLVNTSVTPASEGGVDATNRQGGVNENHAGNSAFDTADFNDAEGSSGNLRVDYVLPSENQEIVDTAVFWPTADDSLFDLVGDFPFPSSDHRLVWADITNQNRKTVTDIEFIGQAEFETGLEFFGTEVGGLSGISYNKGEGIYYAISDDRSQNNDARFYHLSIDLSDGSLDDGNVEFIDFTTLLNEGGVPFSENGVDPEGIAFNGENLFISSEGNVNDSLPPFINQFSLAGAQLDELTIPDKFLPDEEASQGIRNNLAFESLTVTPDQRFLYTATENALVQDGEISTLENESAARIIKYDLETGEAVKEFLYFVDPIPVAAEPPEDFADNGLVELLALDNNGTLLALERSFASGVGNNIRLYEVRLQNTTNIQDFDSLTNFDDPDNSLFDVDAVAEKRLLLDFGELGINLDNDEGMTFGPILPDGSQSLVVVSDNNFNESQVTQFLGFSLNIDSISAVHPTDETPPLLRTETGADADDPAIYLHPNNPAQSLVITSLKDAGLAVYDLDGQLLQEISPATPGDIRFNNVDIVYNFQIGDETVDLAVATDRENDTLAIWNIDPQTRQLTNITAANLSNPAASIFGIDDGEQTAYGLATYTNPNTGETYAFVTQADGNQIAQLELTANNNGTVSATEVRRLNVPIPEGGELEDAQLEGMVVDQELGFLYAGQENLGIWKFEAGANASTAGILIDEVKPNGENIEADVEALTIYYADNGTGYLLASSQGDNTFAVYEREGDNQYLGNFFVGESGNIDGAQESDGADVINVPLGNRFPNGLLVVQDGANEPEAVSQDPEDGEIQNFNTNFKFIPWENVANAFENPLEIDTFNYNPRQISDSLINGIASGDTTQTSTVLWANSNSPGEITFEIATNPNFNNIIETVNADLTNAPVKVEITDLNPATEYYYRVTDAAGSTEIGEFKTAAELGSQNGLKFGVTGDWRGELSPYPAISNADEANLDFFVLHGDTIYADFPSPEVPKEQAETLAEFRAKHQEVYGDRFGENTWADLRGSTSIFATIDDHEVINDFSGGAPANSDSRFPETTGLINDTQLYENGLQAFQEFNPLRDEFYQNTGENSIDGERKLYRFNTFGHDAATFVLDTRSFRDEGLEPVTEATPAAISQFISDSFNPERTLLGKPQLEDLKNDLLQAENNDITWKFIMVPEPIQNFGVGLASDRFEGYAAERTELLKFIDDNNIDNVVFVAADIHGTVVNNLTYQAEFGGEQIATNTFEISTGSVAFEPAFGPSVISLVDLPPEQQALYQSLPVANDGDSEINDKDDFLKSLVNQQLTALGYDPVGLNENLPIAEGQIDATLLQGDYLATHTFGWTQFEIDPDTQQLRVVTYGLDPYTEEELLANPEDIINRELQVVSEFVVNPTVSIPTVSINVEPEIVSENGDQYSLTFNLSEPAPVGGLQVVWSETDSDNALGDIEFPPELTNATNLESLDPVGDELARSAMTIDEGATTATVTWTTIADDEVEGDETTTIELQTTAGYVVDAENQVVQVTIVDAVAQEIVGTPDDERLNGNFGDDTITGLAGNDTLVGRDGDDSIIGSRGDDFLFGNDGNDTLEGRQGFDFLFGGDGDDEMNGGIGRDRFNSGSGDDILTGGASIDFFIYNTNAEFNADDLGVDEITDFVSGQDKIILDTSTFTAINNEVEFTTVTNNNAAATSNAVIVYNTNNGQLFYNPNGSANGFGTGGQFATLSNESSLEVNDLIMR